MKTEITNDMTRATELVLLFEKLERQAPVSIWSGTAGMASKKYPVGSPIFEIYHANVNADGLEPSDDEEDPDPKPIGEGSSLIEAIKSISLPPRWS